MAKGLKSVARSFDGRWDDSIKDDSFTIPSSPTRVRLWDDFYKVFSHWVEFVKDNKTKGFFTLCLAQDPVSGNRTSDPCPYCEVGIKASEHTYGYLLVRKEQKQQKVTKVRPIRMTGGLVSQIAKLSQIVYATEIESNKYDEDSAPDASDPKHGFDVVVFKKEGNKTEYTATQGDRTPLNEEEIVAFEEYVNSNNIGKLVKRSLESYSEAVKTLTNKGLWSKSAPSAGSNRHQIPDDEDEAPPPKAKAKPASRASLTGDDDETPPRKQAWDDEDDSISYSKADASDLPFDDE
jgi:hypothetical protein